jgi:hypothetical protein
MAASIETALPRVRKESSQELLELLFKFFEGFFGILG